MTDENTILQEINVSLNLTEEYLRTLAGGFLFSGDDVLKKVKKLSGGEKVRVSFLKLYMKRANFLILDEPTNHLDIYSIEVLEDALENFDGTMLVVSHNRHFLDSMDGGDGAPAGQHARFSGFFHDRPMQATTDSAMATSMA